MLKKLAIAIAVSAISSTAFAECGPYVGASIGVNDSLNQYRQTVNLGDATASDKYNFGTRGALLNAFAGYGMAVGCNMWLGGEAFVNYASNNTNLVSRSFSDIDDGISTNFTYKIRQRWSWGVSVLPGLMVLDHTMAYVRLGVVQTRFTNTATFSGIDEGVNRSFSASKNENVWGWQAGVGLQTAISPCVDLRGEYVYTGYRSYSLGRDEFGSARVTPSNDQFNVGLVYKFG
jgi:opacity protein-like surface antigen